MNPTEILPGVFVGNQFVAADETFFRRNNIVRVVNCTDSLPFYFPHLAQYMRIPINDSPTFEDNNIMAAYLTVAIEFIISLRPGKQRGVLIHCHAGVSRSCTVAVALLRKCCFPTLKQSIRALLDMRSIAFFRGRYLNFRKALYIVYEK